MISIYNKLSDVEINARRREQLDDWGKIVQYGRQNPVWFIENIFQYQLLDYQKYAIMGGWTARKAVYVQSRGSGKSFIASCIIMTKSVLFPDYVTCIMAPSDRQARLLFNKIKEIALKQIETLVGNDVFAAELQKPNGNQDGFVLSGDAHFDLYNGSKVIALNSNEKKIVGQRCNLCVYDEAGNITEDYFARTEKFITVSSDFKTGVGYDSTVYPLKVPNQCMYFSSAENTATYLWKVYKEGARRMMMGYDDHFVCDITCEMPLSPTMNGKPYGALFDKSEVEDALRSNEYRARREYYNLFDLAGGADNIISSDTIFRNQRQYLPLTANPDPKSGKKYIISIDPAHQVDNNFCLVMEAEKIKGKGWVGRVVNGYNLIKPLPDGEKKLMTTPEAIEFIKKIMLAFNGGAPNWGNIIMFIDPGSGGGGQIIADYLRQDWYDDNGELHYGIIDMDDENSSKERINYPHAVEGVLHLYSPQKFKTDMFSAFADLSTQDLIQFPESCPKGDTAYFDDGEVKLTSEDRRGLVEIDLAKEEIKMFIRVRTDSGKVIYKLGPSASKSAHDDRGYCLAAAAFILANLRKEDEFGGKGVAMDFSKLYGASSKTLNKINNQKRRNPFAGGTNPFRRR